MATYKELQDQISDLQRKAEETRAKELDGAVQEIKALMQDYGITLEDLGKVTSKGRNKTNAKNSTQQPKQQPNIQFQDDNGNTWSGRGRMPEWLKGKDKEKFRISPRS